MYSDKLYEEKEIMKGVGSVMGVTILKNLSEHLEKMSLSPLDVSGNRRPRRDII